MTEMWVKCGQRISVVWRHLMGLITPLPPLEEQKRIVNSIEEFIPYCHQLIK